MKTTPEGETSVAQRPGCAASTGINHKGLRLSGLQPRTTLESSKHIPSKGVCTPAAAPRNPEAPDTTMGMLQHASVSEEHRTFMSMVAERIMSVKSGLNEAFMGLLRGYEVCNVISSIALLRGKYTCV